MKSRTKLGAVVGVLLAAACARTGLDLPDYDAVDAEDGKGLAGQAGGAQAGKAGAGQAGVGQAGAGQAGKAGAPVDGGMDAPLDVGPPCVSDVECDDQIPCTKDFCEPKLGCQNVPVDAVCDDGLFCTGTEACIAGKGCVTNPVDCGDGVGCTDDTCNEAKKACSHAPNDKNCPLSHKCGVDEGCYALAYAHSPDTLFEIRLPSGKVTPIGPLQSPQITDIALSPNGTLYGLAFQALYTVNTMTGKATLLQNVSQNQMVALDAAPDGVLYAGAAGTVYALDAATGKLVPTASYPQGNQASGDIAFLGGKLYASSNPSGGGQTDALCEIGLGGTPSKVIGSIGFDCVWGLAAFGETLYGLTCNGEVLSIDLASGKGTLLTKVNEAFWGASAR